MKNLLLFIIILASCSKEKYSLIEDYPKEAIQFVIEFKSQGKLRGYNFDFKGLKIIVADTIPLVKDHPEYEAYYQSEDHTIYIKSSGYNWNEMRAELVCHELGHAILKRGHDFERLPDGSQKSIMGCPCSNTKNGWSEIGHEHRKKYYFDELFNPSTSSPDWAN